MDRTDSCDAIFTLISKLASGAEEQEIIDNMTALGKKNHIVREEFQINVPVTRLTKNAIPVTGIQYDGKVPYDDEHCLVQSFKNPILGSSVITKLYWNLNFSPSPSDLEFYKALGNLHYLFHSGRNLSQTIDRLRNFDILTEIPHLEYMQRQYDDEVLKTGNGGQYACIFMNIRNMKYYNRKFGSANADSILKKFARRLRNLCDEDEYLARPGGDNFALGIKKKKLEAFLSSVEQIILTDAIKGTSVTISEWIGISIHEDNEPFLARVHKASVAMQMAKNTMHQKIIYYDENAENKMAYAKKITETFEENMAKNAYIPFYQPKVHIPTNKIIGMESLVRWQSEGKILPPGAFVPIIEANDLIDKLDMYMLDKTCADIRRWLDRGIKPPRISVNLSRKNLFDKDLMEKICSIISKHNVPVEHLEIEITETTTLDESQKLIELTKTLRKHGIKVSIDDFGTGYSSLSLLKNIYADIVKIDKTFVDDCIKDQRSFILIKNIITLAKDLGMEIIAEGVETREQADFLLDIGCQNVQGYYYGKPIPFEAISQRLVQQQAGTLVPST